MVGRMMRSMRSPAKRPKFSGPPQVRHEPPTLDEAIAAAQGLAEAVEQQVAIAAGLMGVAEDEVRAQVLAAARNRPAPDMGRAWARPFRPSPVVVVRRRR